MVQKCTLCNRIQKKGECSQLTGALSLVNHKDYIRAEHKLHFISESFISQVIIPQVMFFFLVYLYSAGTQHGNLHPARRPILFCGPTQDQCNSHSQHRRNRARFWKNAGGWTGRVEISKEEIPDSECSMYGYILTYSRL